MKRFLLLVTMLLCSMTVMAQSGRITATIIDSDTEVGVIGAIMEVVSKSNPDVHKHSVSGAEGRVTVTGLSHGEYTVNITFIGYTTQTMDVTVDGTLDLGTINFAPETVAIDAVVKEVQALRTSQNGDTVAYNAAAFRVAADADVEGLLRKMPGITVSNGTVEAQGEQVRRIYVDGREFFGDDVSTALSSLPAQAVERIEVFNKLSDNAEFSGMDDGEGYKAINIVTRSNMRQGLFGKLYGGYGYQPDADGVTSNHKYNVGGNLNLFHGTSRVSVIGLFNNVNQQNFSFEDILGVTGGGGGHGGPGHGRGRGVGQYMVRPQDGVARVGSIGVQYSDSWGEDDKLKLNGSYFFNNTNTRNISRLERWYVNPSPIDTLEQDGYSETVNMNHRFNARLDWNMTDNMMLMSRTNFSFQGNDPFSETHGMQWGESGFNVTEMGSEGSSRAIRFSEFLSYRLRLGKPGRTITVDGRFAYRNTPRSWSNGFSTLATIFDEATGEYSPELRYVSSTSPTSETDWSANFTYTEPVSQHSQVSVQYRFDYENQEIDKTAYITGPDFVTDGLLPDASLSSTTDSRSIEHQVGPGYRYAQGRNTFIANVFYQHSTLDGMVRGENIKRDFDHVTYFIMGNVAFNPSNSLRVFISSYTANPDVRNLQDIYDVSNAQFISKGNPMLRSAYNHRINAHYVRSNIEKGRTFMLMFSTQLTQDYIGQSIHYNPETIVIDGAEYNPLQYTTYENMDGFRSIRGGVSYGFPIAPIKCNLNLSVGVDWSRTPSMINDEVNYTSNMGYNATASLGSNISEDIDFTIQWNGTYNDARQSLAMRTNRNQYFSHTASGTLKWVFWQGFTLTAAVNYNQYLGITNNYNEDYLICNVYLGKKLFANQQGEVLIGVNDLLNQNAAFARTVGSGYVQNAWNSVVGRYFTVQFNYNLRVFGRGATTDMSQYEGMDVRPGAGAYGRPPMPRH